MRADTGFALPCSALRGVRRSAPLLLHCNLVQSRLLLLLQLSASAELTLPLLATTPTR